MAVPDMVAKGDERVSLLEVVAPLELLDVFVEKMRFDAPTIAKPIFEDAPQPIDGIGVDTALLPLDDGVLSILVCLMVHIAVMEPKVFRNTLVDPGPISIEKGPLFDVARAKNGEAIHSAGRTEASVPEGTFFDLIILFEDHKTPPGHNTPNIALDDLFVASGAFLFAPNFSLIGLHLLPATAKDNPSSLFCRRTHCRRRDAHAAMVGHAKSSIFSIVFAGTSWAQK